MDVLWCLWTRAHFPTRIKKKTSGGEFNDILSKKGIHQNSLYSVWIFFFFFNFVHRLFNSLLWHSLYIIGFYCIRFISVVKSQANVGLKFKLSWYNSYFEFHQGVWRKIFLLFYLCHNIVLFLQLSNQIKRQIDTKWKRWIQLVRVFKNIVAREKIKKSGKFVSNDYSCSPRGQRLTLFSTDNSAVVFQTCSAIVLQG